MSQTHTTFRRRGLSLIELVVVLLVLTVLASLVVSLVPNLIRRGHLAKCADTIPELVKVWTRSYAMNVRYPDQCDSLLGPGGADLSDLLVDGLQAQLTVAALTQDEVEALEAIGITRVVDLRNVNRAAGESATYDAAPNGPPFGPVPPRLLTAGGNVAQLNHVVHIAEGNQLNLKRHLNRDGTENPNFRRYIVFGVGPNCTAVGTGRMLQEAPVHFGGDDTINPDRVYQRYLVVFSLVEEPRLGMTAYFEAAAGNDSTGPSSGEEHIRQFYQDQNRDG